MAEQGEGRGEEKKFSIWDLPGVPMGQLPPHLELQRTRVFCNKDAPIHWLPNGSELVKESTANSDSSSKPETYTYFSSSQESVPEFVKNPITPKYPDIILVKLGPGQEIESEVHAVKGIGKTHAKWSPVATAWYRMLPEENSGAGF